ncbi:MAG TPA: GAF domain-containing protein [Pyrinomonadaceae bacterium]|jgi:transcriptional regulator with GAF, ATPase, and Fis domain|nr:GAF domain-containing protein [Pyrinomonadaceae bacterium]
MAKKTGAKTSWKRGTKRSTKRALASGVTFEAQLRDAIRAVDVATLMTSPLRRSIENLLLVAGDAMGSDEASVLVRDGNLGGLKFLVAIGEVADKLAKVRIPPGKGIAGFVFASGQPMAVADVAQEETFYAEVDRATGYSTQTILATPLRVGGETVGVLEFVNRLGDPPYRPFTPDEMDSAAHFADAIATLVDAHETAGLVETLFARSVKADEKSEAGSGKRNDNKLLKWLDRVRSAPEHRDLILLAVRLRDIASRGDAERALCREVLEALDRFTAKKSASGTSYLGF